MAGRAEPHAAPTTTSSGNTTTDTTSTSAATATSTTCTGCSAVFPSRQQLFRHLHDHGFHLPPGAQTPLPAPRPGRNARKRKKRRAAEAQAQHDAGTALGSPTSSATHAAPAPVPAPPTPVRAAVLKPGVVRAGQWPPGWEPRGPPARGNPTADPLLEPQPGEDLCRLSGHWRVFQLRDGHRFSSDDVLTAWYAVRCWRARQRPAPTTTATTATPTTSTAPGRYLDIGCGLGSVLQMVAWAFQPGLEVCVGVEAQAVSAGLARRSVRYNGAEGLIEVRDGDLRDPAAVPEGAVFDLVTGTPPYFKPGRYGEVSVRPQRGPCRFEYRGGIEEYCQAAARALAPGGLFVVVEASLCAERGFVGAANAGLSIVSQLDVVPREGKPALFTVFAMEHAAPGDADGRSARFVHDAPLLIRHRDTTRTQAYCDMLADVGFPPPRECWPAPAQGP